MNTESTLTLDGYAPHLAARRAPLLTHVRGGTWCGMACRGRYMSSFRADSRNGLDLGDLLTQLPSKMADEEGRATWLPQAPPRYCTAPRAGRNPRQLASFMAFPRCTRPYIRSSQEQQLFGMHAICYGVFPTPGVDSRSPPCRAHRALSLVLLSRGRRLVMGAERDRIVDEAGIKEMATFLDTDHVMLPTVPHEVSLRSSHACTPPLDIARCRWIVPSFVRSGLVRFDRDPLCSGPGGVQNRPSGAESAFMPAHEKFRISPPISLGLRAGLSPGSLLPSKIL